jgi:hypothetical protein
MYQLIEAASQQANQGMATIPTSRHIGPEITIERWVIVCNMMLAGRSVKQMAEALFCLTEQRDDTGHFTKWDLHRYIPKEDSHQSQNRNYKTYLEQV